MGANYSHLIAVIIDMKYHSIVKGNLNFSFKLRNNIVYLVTVILKPGHIFRFFCQLQPVLPELIMTSNYPVGQTLLGFLF